MPQQNITKSQANTQPHSGQPAAAKDTLDREVIYVLGFHVGQQNAIGHRELVTRIFGSLTDANDRLLRAAIERLRHRGNLIANLQTGDGYFVAGTAEEYQSFRAIYGAHALPILEAIRKMDALAADRWEDPRQPRLI